MSDKVKRVVTSSTITEKDGNDLAASITDRLQQSAATSRSKVKALKEAQGKRIDSINNQHLKESARKG